MTAEALRAYSAEKLFTATRSSCTESALGVRLVTPPRGLALTLAESMRKLLDSARWPFALRFTPNSALKTSAVAWAYACPPPEGSPVTPGTTRPEGSLTVPSMALVNCAQRGEAKNTRVANKLGQVLLSTPIRGPQVRRFAGESSTWSVARHFPGIETKCSNFNRLDSLAA